MTSKLTSKQSQREFILALLKKPGRSITQKRAANYYGIYRLASIIHRLRRAGHDIATELIPWNGSHYAKYYISKPEKK